MVHLGAHGIVRESGHDDDGHAQPVSARGLSHVGTGHLGHALVGDEQIHWTVAGQKDAEIETARCGLDIHAKTRNQVNARLLCPESWRRNCNMRRNRSALVVIERRVVRRSRWQPSRVCSSPACGWGALLLRSIRMNMLLPRQASACSRWAAHKRQSTSTFHQPICASRERVRWQGDEI
jgi:hypothetical protein